MTSTTNTRLCEVAVVKRRSMHSVATPTAVSNPNVASVMSRSLSMVLGTPMTRKPASERRCPMCREPSPPMVIKASMPAARNSPTSSSVRSTEVHVPSSSWTGYAHGLPRLVLPRTVPPRWPMPRTKPRVSVNVPPSSMYSSGNIKPLNPSRMPITSQSRCSAASVADRITELSPGASPPPVEIAILTGDA